MRKNLLIASLFIPLLFLFAGSNVNGQLPCASNGSLGSASNIFSQILNGTNPIACDNDLNTVVFIHRNNASTFGGHSGQLRYDISTNGGVSWTTDQGVLNPASVNGSNAARYPNVAIYNPSANTNPNNAYLAYMGATVGSTWNGEVSGVRKLDGTGNTENYNQPASSNTLIPRDLVRGAPGVFWAMDAISTNGATPITGFRVYKGTWNSTDVSWTTSTTLTPTFNTSYNGSEFVADWSIGFDPSGMYGWICILTDVSVFGSPHYTDYGFRPVYYKTVDGGNSWTGPEQVEIADFPCISSNLGTNLATTAFRLDLTVDANGDPHTLIEVGGGPGTYSVYSTLWTSIYDLTHHAGTWTPVLLGSRKAFRGTWGVTPNEVTMDMRPQMSRTADGTKVFFFWTDSDTAGTGNNNNQNPNLFGRGYNTTTKMMTGVKNFTSCNATYANKILFPSIAEECLGLSGTYITPAMLTQLNISGSTLDPSAFYYLNGVGFQDSEFTTSVCAAAGTLSAGGPTTFCSGGSVTLTAPSGYTYNWSTGATTQSISASASGTYSVTYTLSGQCCLAEADSVVVTVNPGPTASFTDSISNLVVDFTDASTTGGGPSWLWDFGDGNTSTQQNPQHTYAAPGSYTVCLTVTDSCGSDSTCMTVITTCTPGTPDFSFVTNQGTVDFTDLTAGNPTTWLWDFGDGNLSTTQNPQHIYTASGTYTVCLTITDSCGTDSICKTVSVTIAGLSSMQNVSVSVFPNPAGNQVNVAVGEMFTENVEIGLFDIYGKKITSIYSGDLSGSYYSIVNLENLSQGCYFINVRSADFNRSIRFMKQN